MSVGFNSVILGGNIGKITYTETNVKADPIVTFLLCIEEDENICVWCKCSAYGKKALYIKDKINKGDYVILQGKIANKKSYGSDHLETEVKITGKISVNKKLVGQQIPPSEYDVNLADTN